MADPNLEESAWLKAKQDAKGTYATTEFGLFASLVTVVGGSVAAVAADGERAITQYAILALGGAGALLLTCLVVFVGQAFLAPVRQRNDLRRHWLGRPGRAPVPAAEVELKLRNMRRLGDDLREAIGANLGYSSSERLRVEDWTTEAIDLLADDLDEEAAVRFVEASRGVADLGSQLRARLDVLGEIVDQISAEQP